MSNTFYANYLRSWHWSKLKKSLSAHTSCFFCGKKGKLEHHHRTYKTKNGKSALYREGQKTVYKICPRCHATIHHHFGTQELSAKVYQRARNQCAKRRKYLTHIFIDLIEKDFDNIKSKAVSTTPLESVSGGKG